MNEKKLSYLLSDFYKNPIATVSFELILTIILVLALTVFAIKPTLTTMGELSKEIKQKQDVDTKLKQKIASLGSAQTEYISRKDQLELLSSALPSSDTSLNDLKTIEKLAFDNNLVLTSLSLSSFPKLDAGQKPQVINHPVSLSVEGDYVSIKNFVSSLLENRRVFMISTITFSIKKQRGSGDSLSASMTINTPYYF